MKSMPPPCQVSYVHKPGDKREKSEEREEGGRAQEKGAGPTEYTAGLLSCVRGEESNLQVPNY